MEKNWPWKCPHHPDNRSLGPLAGPLAGALEDMFNIKVKNLTLRGQESTSLIQFLLQVSSGSRWSCRPASHPVSHPDLVNLAVQLLVLLPIQFLLQIFSRSCLYLVDLVVQLLVLLLIQFLLQVSLILSSCFSSSFSSRSHPDLVNFVVLLLIPFLLQISSRSCNHATFQAFYTRFGAMVIPRIFWLSKIFLTA